MELFKEELAFFEEKKEELLKSHRGQFALIKGRNLAGIFATPEEAYKEGVRQFGLETFLIKGIVERERVERIPLLAFTDSRANL